jgi:hypothetical protein
VGLRDKKVVGPSELLAAAAAIAAGTQAYGEVVIFINPDWGEPGHFDWNLGPEVGPPGTPAQWLDITRPSTDQGGLVGPSSVGQLYLYYYLGNSQNITRDGANVAISGGGSFGFTWAFETGDQIDGSSNFTDYALHAEGVWYYYPYQFIVYSSFPSNEIGYMGVRFSDVDGYHYGWIGVVRNYVDFDAFAWGYETEPGVPIIAGIPAPGTLAALAFGAAVTRRGRKREKS